MNISKKFSALISNAVNKDRYSSNTSSLRSSRFYKYCKLLKLKLLRTADKFFELIPFATTEWQNLYPSSTPSIKVMTHIIKYIQVLREDKNRWEGSGVKV